MLCEFACLTCNRLSIKLILVSSIFLVSQSHVMPFKLKISLTSSVHGPRDLVLPTVLPTVLLTVLPSCHYRWMSVVPFERQLAAQGALPKIKKRTKLIFQEKN